MISPLPESIPKPNQQQTIQLEAMGIKTISTIYDLYVKYKLPPGWKMVDSSWRRDMPNFHIVDDNNMKRVTISGVWKEAYNNKIELYVLEEPRPYKKPKDKMIENSAITSATVMGLVGEMIDPLGRPVDPPPKQVSRYDDYVPSNSNHSSDDTD